MDLVTKGVVDWYDFGCRCGTQALEELLNDALEAKACGRPVEVSYEGARGKVEYSGDSAQCVSDMREALAALNGRHAGSCRCVDLSCNPSRT